MAPAVRKWLAFAAKLGLAAAIMYFIFSSILHKQDADKLWAHLSELSWPIALLCPLGYFAAIFANVLRWDLLLEGQGIKAPKSYLAGTFMIARFFAAVGGLIGLSGFRFYDITKRTGKAARAGASIGIEMVIGNLAMGILALISSLFGVRYVGTTGVIALALFFGTLIAVTFTILWRPRVVRLIAERLPAAAAKRIQTAVDAVCAYEGKGTLLAKTVGLGVVVHFCNNFVYVLAAKALGVDLPISELFFVSTLQNIVSHLPLTPNGVGLREMTAVGLYAAVGLPVEQSVLIPLVGFTADMAVSALGGLVFLRRRSDYAPEIRVIDSEREERVYEQIERAPEAEWPRVARGAALGFSAGALAGLCVGFGEAAAVVAASHGKAESDVWFYGSFFYALMCALGGAGAGALLAFSGRLMQRKRSEEHVAFAHFTGTTLAVFTLVIGAFRVQRDVFHEELKWLSGQGVLVLAGALLSAVAVYALSFFLLRALSREGRLPALKSPLTALVLFALTTGVALFVSRADTRASDGTSGDTAHPRSGSKVAVAQGGSVLFIVVDTLRADHLPVYGYSAGKTPALDAFARDSVRFSQSYANASWTRPSFASLLTGRYASSHGVMSKASSLPDEAVTLSEVFANAGYRTGGIVTNYNVAPFFNFAQGFDEFHYLAPNFVFGASDTSAKLSLIQIMRRVDEKARSALGRTEPGSAYQDAEVVNEQIEGFLANQRAGQPWLLFVGYMDPHDPYYEHPYSGVGYSRAAHVKPDPRDADKLRKLYDGEITFWDQHFGALMNGLKKRGLYDGLTIVVTSDHGEEFLDHGGFWHGTTLYDEQLHVPLLVKLPGNKDGGSVVSHWVESVDIMPTLLARHGLSVPEAVQGVDLFRGKEQTFAEESHEGNVLKALRLRDQAGALKLIRANAENPRGLRPEELYRVDTDPGERDDLAPKAGQPLTRAQSELSQVEEKAKSGALKAREVDLAMDKTAEDRLKALGYANE